MKRKREKEKPPCKELPHRVWEEIAISVRILKNVADASTKVGSDFINKLYNLFMQMGKEGTLITGSDVTKLINSTYLIEPVRQHLTQEQIDEYRLVLNTAYDITTLICGNHKLIVSQKVTISSEDVRKELPSLFYGESMEEKELTKIPKIELSGDETPNESEGS